MRTFHSCLPLSRSRNRWIATILFAFASFAAVASGEVKSSLVATDTGKIYFNSAEKDTTYFQLYKHTAVFGDAIWGDLRFPPNMNIDKVPVMVVMHGSGGVTKGVYAWVEYLNSIGVATFMIDSFTTRGIKRTVEDQSQLNPSTTTADALLALKLLATHPRIDASKIGIVGFSKGGNAAMTASFERIRSAVVPGDLKYALHIPFYGGCTQYAKTTSAPILMFTGTNDAYHTTEECQKNVDSLKSKGANLKFVVYEGALHGFDTGNPHSYVPRGQTWIKCSAQMDMDSMESYLHGESRVTPRAEALDYRKSCMSLGLSVGGDDEYREKSRKEVKDFLTQNFAIGSKK